jgi:hypothetical protein
VGRLLEFGTKSCATRYRGGDPLSTESRVACGC